MAGTPARVGVCPRGLLPGTAPDPVVRACSGGGRTRRQELHRTRASPPPLPNPRPLPRSTPTTLLACPPQRPPGQARRSPTQPTTLHSPGLVTQQLPVGGVQGRCKALWDPGPPPPFHPPCTSPTFSLARGALLTPHLPALSASQPRGTKAGGSRRFMKHRCRGPAPTTFNCPASQVMLIPAGSGLLSCCPGVPLRHHVLPAPTQAGARASFPRCSAQL